MYMTIRYIGCWVRGEIEICTMSVTVICNLKPECGPGHGPACAVMIVTVTQWQAYSASAAAAAVAVAGFS